LINTVQIALIGLNVFISVMIGYVLLLFGQRTAIRGTSWIWSYAMCAIVGIRVRVAGREHVRDLPPAIYVSNHLSHLDIPCLFLAIPHPLFFIAKKELRKVPFMGWYMQACGMIFLDRRNKEKAMEGMRQAGQEINKGKNVISFPEGTRSKDGRLARFKRGTFLLAIESNVPVVPVALKGSYRLLPSGSYYLRSGTVHVTIGEPIATDTWTLDQVDDFAVHVRSEVEKLGAPA